MTVSSKVTVTFQVLVLVKGEIAERVRHEELLAKRGFYYDLYMSQFKRQEAVEVRNAEHGMLNGQVNGKVTAAMGD